MAAVITSKDVVHFYWLNRPLCKFGIFLPFLCLHLDANVIAGLSIERVICVFKPLQAAHIITKFRVKLYLASIFVFFLVFNAESIIRYDWYEITDDNLGIKFCEPMHFYGLSGNYWQIKDVISDLLASFIPLTIISVCNVALLIKLARRQKMQVQLGVSINQSEHTRTNRMIITIMVAYTVLLSPAVIYSIAVGQKNYQQIGFFFAILDPQSPHGIISSRKTMRYNHFCCVFINCFLYFMYKTLICTLNCKIIIST